MEQLDWSHECEELITGIMAPSPTYSQLGLAGIKVVEATGGWCLQLAADYWRGVKSIENNYVIGFH